MYTPKFFQRALATAFVVSMSTVASAHVFPKLHTAAELAAEKAAACAAAAQPARRTLARFAVAPVVSPGVAYEVAGPHRFQAAYYVAPVACPHPITPHYVACR